MYSFLKEPPTSYNLQAPLSPPLTQHLALFYRYTFSATQVTMSHGGPALNLSTRGLLQGEASFPWPTLIPVPSLREHGAGPLRLDRRTVQRHFLIRAHSDRSLPSNQHSWTQREHLCSSSPSEAVPRVTLGLQSSDLIKPVTVAPLSCQVSPNLANVPINLPDLPKHVRSHSRYPARLLDLQSF